MRETTCLFVLRERDGFWITGVSNDRLEACPTLEAGRTGASMDAAVAFCIFNRPDLTARVFAAIREERPRRLLVIGDGPRREVAGEASRVAECRAIAEAVDWPCVVERNYSDTNLGCRLRMASGLDWAFSRAEALVVLEDDCLPGAGFFPFVTSLLERYADDERVMMISGDCFVPRKLDAESYRFSRWAHIWGWASWRRAWRHYDLSISTWPELRELGWLHGICDGAGETGYWTSLFDQVHAGGVDTWDFSWMYACWLHQGLTILPTNNLVSNIGFRADATHTTDPASALAGLPAGAAQPLVHPRNIFRDRLADLWTWENVFRPTAPLREPEKPRRWGWRIPGFIRQRSLSGPVRKGV